METYLELTQASLLLSPLLGTSALLEGAQVFSSSGLERLELHERKYTNYYFYVTKINSTFDYMKLITVFLPSTGEACSSAVVSGFDLDNASDKTITDKIISHFISHFRIHNICKCWC